MMLGIFLDTETNGLDPFTHKIIEIALCIMDIDTGAILESYQAVILQSFDAWQKSDINSLQINGFNWDQVSFGKDPSVVKEEIKDLFVRQNIKRGTSVFICQNPSFDRPFFSQLVDPAIQEELCWPYHWLDLASMHWATALVLHKKSPWKIGLSKDSIALFYNLPAEKKPHRAMNGVHHLIACYQAIFGFPSS